MYHRKRKHIGHRSKYTKVPIKTKLKFLRKVVIQGLSIKDSATIFNINYSTAKTLIGQYKNKTFVCNLSAFTEETDLDLEDCNRQRCGYREVLADYQERVSHTVSGSPLFYLQSGAKEDHEQLRLKMVSQYVPRIEIISSNSCK